MLLLSLSDYARRHGVSKQAAAKWKGKGFLVLRGDRIDADASDEQMRKAGVGPFRGTVNGVNRAATGAVDSTPKAGSPLSDHTDLGAFLEALMRGEYATQIDADRVKANALAALRVIELQKRASAIVEFEIAESVLFEQARTWRDSWMNWPARVAPLLAADLGLEADKVVEVLTAHVHQHLEQLGEPGDAAALFADREG